MCKTIVEHGLRLLEAGKQPNFNLSDEFKKANDKYFNGELTEIPMRYTKLKDAFGKVRAMVKKKRGGAGFIEVNLTELLITNVYDFTEEQFLSTFLHELCHVYMLQNFREYSFIGGYHGVEWKALSKRVSNESGIPITVDETPDGYIPFEDPKPKKTEPYVVILKKRADSPFAAVSWTSLSVWNKKGDDWINTYMSGLDMYNRPTTDKHIVLLTNDPRPEMYAKKAIQRPVMYKIDPDIPLDILKNKKYEKILFASK